eukprot:scaffold140323_cov18-Tisochrysis_lutea.AAC.1
MKRGRRQVLFGCAGGAIPVSMTLGIQRGPVYMQQFDWAVQVLCRRCLRLVTVWPLGSEPFEARVRALEDVCGWGKSPYNKYEPCGFFPLWVCSLTDFLQVGRNITESVWQSHLRIRYPHFQREI